MTWVTGAVTQFSPLPAKPWKMALTSRQMDPATLGPSEHFGYVVDAGTGSFMDPAAGKLFDARNSRDDDFHRQVSRGLLTADWINLRPDPTREENIICFSSGFGDGSYPSFFGFDANGQVCQLVTDFGLIYEEPEDAKEGRRWWQFWK